MNIPRIKFNKPTIVLLVATSMGLLAALIARSYLSSRMEEIEVKAKGRMVELVVASTDLEKGAVLSSENVSVRPIPVEYAHESAVTPQVFTRAEGEKLGFPVKAGQMILWSSLESKKAPTFSSRVEVGRRAMTVPVDEISSISGMLEPGDVIDLIVTLDKQGSKTTFPLLQGVQVMATGQRAVDDPKSGERREYSTVTLDTTPEQAQHVITAREGGKLTALLRNPQDQKQMAIANLDVDKLLNGAPPGAGLPSKASKTPGAYETPGQNDGIPVLYGGFNSKFTPEQLQMESGRRAMQAWQTTQEQAMKEHNAIASRAASAAESAARQLQVLSGGNAQRP